MHNKYCETPVLIICFNRPDHLRELLKALAIVKPANIYVSSDGPKQEREDDHAAVAECRFLIESIDWPCQIRRKFNEHNLGMKKAVISAISWYFSMETEGIILEDDCIPHPSFFEFCTEMLDHYRDNLKVMHIAGTNQQFGKKIGDGSYYFSSFPSIWGWASWRRVWDLYDEEMSAFPKIEAENVLWKLMPNEILVNHLHQVLRSTFEKKSLTWDHQLGITIVANSGLCIVPNVNLITNIGVPKVKVDGQWKECVVSRIPSKAISKPYQHPTKLIHDMEADINQASWTYEDVDVDEKILFRLKESRHTKIGKLKSLVRKLVVDRTDV
jgi:hypothetical protein